MKKNTMIGRTYFERGEPVRVLVRWGPGGGPRNVLIERADGTRVVRPFRGLRRYIEEAAVRFCGVGWCDRVHYARGMCRQHYIRWRKSGDPGGPIRQQPQIGCTVEGCYRKHYGKGLCSMHYTRKRYRDSTGDAMEIKQARLLPHKPQHGTLNEYNNFGCRCDKCRSANTEYMRGYRARLKVLA